MACEALCSDCGALPWEYSLHEIPFEESSLDQVLLVDVQRMQSRRGSMMDVKCVSQERSNEIEAMPNAHAEGPSPF